MKTSSVEDLAYGRQKDFPIVIASMPASTRERRSALGVIVLLLVTFLIIAPFASVPLAQIDAFIPVLQTVLCIADLITATLLFAQFSIEPLRGVLLQAKVREFRPLPERCLQQCIHSGRKRLGQRLGRQ